MAAALDLAINIAANALVTGTVVVVSHVKHAREHRKLAERMATKIIRAEKG